MLLLCGALVSGPYALITTAVSADLVSDMSLSAEPGTGGQVLAEGSRSVAIVMSPVDTCALDTKGRKWHLRSSFSFLNPPPPSNMRKIDSILPLTAVQADRTREFWEFVIANTMTQGHVGSWMGTWDRKRWN